MALRIVPWSKYLFLVTQRSLISRAQAVAKGGIADSKDSDKHQTSLRTVKKPMQDNTLIYSMREEADCIRPGLPVFIWIERRRQKEVQ